MCVTNRHDMNLVVKVALNPNTTNKPILLFQCSKSLFFQGQKAIWCLKIESLKGLFEMKMYAARNVIPR